MSANSFRVFFVKLPQNRHPERSAAQDDDSVGELTERGPLCGSRGALQVPRLPQIPVKNRSFGELHAALFAESRIRYRW
jgi:hypothetical protein